MRRAPKATIKDQSIEATAVRADGSHHPAKSPVSAVFLSVCAFSNDALPSMFSSLQVRGGIGVVEDKMSYLSSPTFWFFR